MTKTKTRLSWLVLALMLVLALIPHAAFGEEEDEYYSDYEEEYAPSYLVGVDVSEWNGTIDWERVQEDGIEFAILRCGGTYEWSDGIYDDDEFLRNALECERLGIPYGVYYYSSAMSSEAALNEAWFVLEQLQGLSPSLPVFIDLEYQGLNSIEYADTLATVASTFCDSMSYAGYQPGVYANISWWDYLLTDSCFDQWPKWVAQYEHYCESDDCMWWQYTCKGSVSGIDWPVDMNIWYV